jgi:hypothetical protein
MRFSSRLYPHGAPGARHADHPTGKESAPTNTDPQLAGVIGHLTVALAATEHVLAECQARRAAQPADTPPDEKQAAALEVWRTFATAGFLRLTIAGFERKLAAQAEGDCDD